MPRSLWMVALEAQAAVALQPAVSGLTQPDTRAEVSKRVAVLYRGAAKVKHGNDMSATVTMPAYRKSSGRKICQSTAAFGC